MLGAHVLRSLKNEPLLLEPDNTGVRKLIYMLWLKAISSHCEQHIMDYDAYPPGREYRRIFLCLNLLN